MEHDPDNPNACDGTGAAGDISGMIEVRLNFGGNQLSAFDDACIHASSNEIRTFGWNEVSCYPIGNAAKQRDLFRNLIHWRANVAFASR